MFQISPQQFNIYDLFLSRLWHTGGLNVGEGIVFFSLSCLETSLISVSAQMNICVSKGMMFIDINHYFLTLLFVIFHLLLIVIHTRPFHYFETLSKQG